MLSIIIPTLNEENYLPLLLESIKEQGLTAPQKLLRNFKDYEIIVADANSKDKTVEIARGFGCKVVKGGLPPNGKNEGAKTAIGDLFLFLDADVVLLNNSLEKILKEFKKRKLDVATCLLKPQTKNYFLKFLFNLFYNWPILILEKILPHATSAILVKKEIHQKLNGFNEEIKLGEDHVYVRKASKIGKFGVLKSAKIFYSSRRFEREGWVKTYLKYFLAELYTIFLGEIKSNIFKYRFNHYLKKLKN